MLQNSHSDRELVQTWIIIYSFTKHLAVTMPTEQWVKDLQHATTVKVSFRRASTNLFQNTPKLWSGQTNMDTPGHASGWIPGEYQWSPLRTQWPASLSQIDTQSQKFGPNLADKILLHYITNIKHREYSVSPTQDTPLYYMLLRNLLHTW